MDGSQVTVPLMQRQTARVPYAEGNGYRAVQLPYTGEAVDMLIILPEQGHFAAIEGQLSAGFFDEVRRRAELRDVTLSMPRFDFETALNLSGLLQAMGMTDAFGMGAADFSGMVEGGSLFISAALHRATIAVDEKGAEAAAATLVATAESALEQVTLTIDRPFMFAIVERETGTILFLGRVINPVAG